MLFRVYDNLLLCLIGSIQRKVTNPNESTEITMEYITPSEASEINPLLQADSESTSEIDLESLELETASLTESNQSEIQPSPLSPITQPPLLVRKNSILEPVITLTRKWKTLLFTPQTSTFPPSSHTNESQKATTKNVIRHTNKGKARISSGSYLSLIILWCLRYVIVLLITHSLTLKTFITPCLKIFFMHSCYRGLETILQNTTRLPKLPVFMIRLSNLFNEGVGKGRGYWRGVLCRNMNGIVTNLVIYVGGIGSLLFIILISSKVKRTTLSYL